MRQIAKKVLRVLLVEHSKVLTKRLTDELTRAGYDIKWRRAHKKTEFAAALQKPGLDLILCDDSLPDLDPPSVIRHLKDRDKNRRSGPCDVRRKTRRLCLSDLLSRSKM